MKARLLVPIMTIAAAAAAGAGLAGGAALADDGGDGPVQSGSIHACVHTNGKLRVVAADADCRNPESPIAWNRSGPAGPKGEPGTPGFGEITTVGNGIHLSPSGRDELVTRIEVDCPAGTVAIAGGFRGGTALRVAASAPTDTGWFIHANNPTDEPISADVVATCVEVAS